MSKINKPCGHQNEQSISVSYSVSVFKKSDLQICGFDSHPNEEVSDLFFNLIHSIWHENHVSRKDYCALFKLFSTLNKP